MKTLLRVVLFAITLSNVAFAAEAASSRLQASATVLNEIMAAPDKGIPSDILSSAKCVAVVPSLLKGGFVVGGAHGRGMATCRTATGWTAPAPLTTTGGSIGLQIGGQAVDLVMVIMNDRGMQALLSSKFKLGADASVAAGPVGRHTEGSTDWKLRAEVLTYSRARGLFAGISFNGAVIKQDEDATREVYGRMVDFKTILTGSVATPQSAEAFIAAVRQAINEVDADLPVYEVRTMNQVIAGSVAQRRFAMLLLVVFAIAALLLAAVGLYGVTAYAVTQRTQEIGIRMALGARALDIAKLVIGQSLKLTLIGVVIGLAASFALTRLMSSLLFGVSATDPITFVVIPLLLALVSLAACYFPARRALKVDPMVALRYE